MCKYFSLSLSRFVVASLVFSLPPFFMSSFIARFINFLSHGIVCGYLSRNRTGEILSGIRVVGRKLSPTQNIGRLFVCNSGVIG